MYPGGWDSCPHVTSLALEEGRPALRPLVSGNNFRIWNDAKEVCEPAPDPLKLEFINPQPGNIQKRMVHQLNASSWLNTKVCSETDWAPNAADRGSQIQRSHQKRPHEDMSDPHGWVTAGRKRLEKNITALKLVDCIPYARALSDQELAIEFSVYLCGSLFMHAMATRTSYKHHRIGRLISNTGQSCGRSPIEFSLACELWRFSSDKSLLLVSIAGDLR